jgi:hypothetical protein
VTAKELAVVRDKVTRARLEKSGVVLTTAADRQEKQGVEAGVATGERQDARPAVQPKVGDAREPRRYPVPGVTSILECPIHELVVALDNQGRIVSSCPACRREAEAAIERLVAA